MKKTNAETLAIKKLIKSGWTKAIVLGVRADGRVALAHNDLPPIEIVGLIECLKMTTVRMWSESEDRIDEPG